MKPVFLFFSFCINQNHKKLPLNKGNNIAMAKLTTHRKSIFNRHHDVMVCLFIVILYVKSDLTSLVL